MLLRAPKTAGVAAIASALALGACGGEDRQDADEPEGTYAVRVVEADFPERQALADQVKMRIRVRNEDQRTIPNLAVTVDSFERRKEQADLADPQRPIWIVDNGPVGGTTAYTNTWAVGRLRPGQERELVWTVTAVEPGRHEVAWRVAAGLDGKAKARLPGGGVPRGDFDVRVRRRPPGARVDPETGRVIRTDPLPSRRD